MNSFVEEIVTKIEPLEDPIYGPRYRCSLTLKDGTYLPCAVLQSKERIVELAKRRIKETAKKSLTGNIELNGQIVSVFATGGNRINDYNVLSASESKFAIPRSLLSQIHGETTMGWTGWVFKMTDGNSFSYATQFNTEFFDLPEGYDFSSVTEVINHSLSKETAPWHRLFVAEAYRRDTIPIPYSESAFFLRAPSKESEAEID
jgi:hypothetical protein